MIDGVQVLLVFTVLIGPVYIGICGVIPVPKSGCVLYDVAVVTAAVRPRRVAPPSQGPGKPKPNKTLAARPRIKLTR
jgi:hypothetical protein